jgi:hypothetical protein
VKSMMSHWHTIYEQVNKSAHWKTMFIFLFFSGTVSVD